jgi:iron complex outermembrane receptor protein
MPRLLSRLLCTTATCLLLLSLGAPAAWAQTGAIEGRVVDAQTGTALAGVNVSLADTTLGAATGTDGRFAIQGVPVGAQTVTASFVGYQTAEETVTVRRSRVTELQVRLSPETVEGSGVTVLAYRQYASDLSTSGLRLNAPVLDVPQSVQTVTSDFLQDQDVDRLDEMLRNVSGVNAFSSYIDFTMRGFRTSAVLIDGTKALGSFFFANPKLADVERIEVVKGPSSVLYGQLEPGGLINVITKEPRSAPSRTVSLEAGSRSQYEFTADLTGPLAADGLLQYRLIGDVESSGSFRRFQDTRRAEVAPKLSFVPGPSTTITVEGSYYNEVRDGQRDRGIAAPPDAQGNPDRDALPIEWTSNEPGDRATSSGASGQVEVDHAFSDTWSLDGVTRLSQTTYTNAYHEPRGFGVQNGATFVGRQYRDQVFDVVEFATNLNLVGDVTTGPLRHRLLVGGDIYTSDTRTDYTYRDAPPLNVFNPDYGGRDPSTYPVSLELEGTRLSASYGSYVQALTTITPAIKVLGGVRYDAFAQELDRTINDQAQQVTASEGAFTFRGGTVVQPVEQLSLYGSYSEGFNPPSVFSQGADRGGPFGPTESWQLEAGAKAQFFDGRLTASLAGYQIAKTNVLVGDPDDPNRLIALGEVGSQGVEVDAIGSITPNWSLTANYAYNNAEVTEDSNPDNVGQEQPNAPNHTAALWTRYDIPDLGLGIGGGAIFVGERETFGAVTLPSYTVFDAAIYYQWRRYSVQLNAKNLFDRRHFLGGYGATALWPGQPRTLNLRVSVDF